MKKKSKGKKPNITLRQSDVKRIKEQCTTEAMQMVLGMVYLTLHTQYGFGQKRLEKFRAEIEKACDYYNQGKIKLSDVNRYMEKDLKFDSRLWEE